MLVLMRCPLLPKKPKVQRDLPFGIVTSLSFCTIVYIVVAGFLTGVVNYTELNVSSPVAHALTLIGFNGASALISTGVIAGLTTVMLVLYYGLTRIIFAMSRDGLLSPLFSKVNPKTQTPVRIIILCGIIMAFIAGFIPLGDLAELVNIGTLAAFVLVCLGVIVLRITKPDMHPLPHAIQPSIPGFGHDVMRCADGLSAIHHLVAFHCLAFYRFDCVFWLFNAPQ